MDRTSTDRSGADGADVIRLDAPGPATRGGGPIAQIEGYWHAVRAGRLVPQRSDIDPRGIEGALSHAFIVERIAPGHARIRIAGTHLSDVMGMEVRGMPLSALFDPEGRDRLQAAMRCLFDDPAIQRMTLRSNPRIGKPALDARMVLFPLRNDLGEISRALGCLVCEGKIGRAPRRFDVLRIQRQRLYEDDLTYETPETGAKVPPQVAAAEPTAEFKNTAVPWLRLVHGHKRQTDD